MDENTINQLLKLQFTDEPADKQMTMRVSAVEFDRMREAAKTHGFQSVKSYLLSLHRWFVKECEK